MNAYCCIICVSLSLLISSSSSISIYYTACSWFKRSCSSLAIFSCIYYLAFIFLSNSSFYFFLFGVLLLITDQVFDHSRLGNMLVTLVVVQFFLLLFFLLCIIHILLYFLAMSSFVVQNLLPLFLFLSFMKKSYLSLLVQFHLLP